MDTDINIVAQKLHLAVECALNPHVWPSERKEAQEYCENFKDHSPICVPCALVLSSVTNSDKVRHFGLQVLEHTIKYKWSDMPEDERISIQNNVMCLLEKGTKDILSEQPYVKNALVKSIVELIKRQWPQKWLSLLADLNRVSKLGATQSELVFLVLLRWAEDVIQFQNIPPQRRRDITQGLTANMSELFTFFMQNLQASIGPTLSMGDTREIKVCVKVAQSILSALTGYVDWINISYIVENNGYLLSTLCMLLSNRSYQIYAADVLLIIISRKGKPEERKPLMILFCEEAMHQILTAAEGASLNSASDEYSFSFLKKLCQVLTAIGDQLNFLWGHAEGIKRPDNFETYLQAILAITRHPSKMLGIHAYSLWVSFLRHKEISQDALLHAIIANLVDVSSKSLLKVGFPSQNNHESCQYSRYDFDSDLDFNLFFSRFRAEVTEVVRQITLLRPATTLQYISHWINSVLSLTIGSEAGHCNLSSPSFLEWDGMSIFLESVMSRIQQSKAEQPPPDKIIVIFKSVLEYNTQDPLILSCILSCISALFPYLKYAQELLPVILQKIFSSVVFSLPGQTKSNRSKAVKNVRRHACSGLVRICKQYPSLLAPAFDEFYEHIKKISSDPDQLSQMEKCTLMEALILISNDFKDFDRQSKFIGEILVSVKNMWMSDEIQSAFSSPEQFMSFIGVDQAAVEPSSADTCGINRSHIIYCINNILGVIKRSRCPEEEQACRSGRFVSNWLDNGQPVYKNPATQHIKELLPNLLNLIKVMNTLWEPQYIQRRHPDFAQAYHLGETEKLTVLGIQPPYVDNMDFQNNKCPLERMQNFLGTAYDTSCHILGNAGQCLGPDIYFEIPSLAQHFTQSSMIIFGNPQLLPEYKMKSLVRIFLRPYIQHCPLSCYQTCILPLLTAFCPLMQLRLTAKWTIIDQRSADGVLVDDNPESDECVEDQLTRQVTREYAELLNSVLLYVKRQDDQQTNSEAMNSDDNSEKQSNVKEPKLSEIGQLVMDNESVYPAVILVIFSGLSWDDTSICHKFSTFCLPIVKYMIEKGRVTNELAVFMFSRVLYGLQQHGEHEMNQYMLLGLGLHIYQTLVKLNVCVNQVLTNIPNAPVEMIDKLKRCLEERKTSEKKLKDIFKKIVSPIIGVSLGEKFKREVKIENLPQMFRRRRKENDNSEDKINDISSLFRPQPK